MQKSKELESNNLTFINADATTYNYKNIKDVNVVTLSNVLEHIEHRVDFLNSILRKPIFKDKKIKCSYKSTHDNKRLAS